MVTEHFAISVNSIVYWMRLRLKESREASKIKLIVRVIDSHARREGLTGSAMDDEDSMKVLDWAGRSKVITMFEIKCRMQRFDKPDLAGVALRDQECPADRFLSPSTMYAILASLALSLALSSNAFYLPGAAPRNYGKGDQVDLFVNALTPMLSGKDDAKLVRFFTSSQFSIL